MKKEVVNKKGFTLIELLAVIIILAIVALIATPIILDVVEDARKSAGLSESNMILSGINNYCATEEIKIQMNSDYEQICKNSLVAEDVKKMVNLGNAEILEIEYNNKLIWLKVKSNGKIYSLQDNAMVEGDLDKPEAKYTVGDLLKVQVSDSEIQNIYVLEVNGDEIVGILDRNLPGETVAWISEEDYNAAGGNWSNDSDEVKNQNLYEYGPVTANKILNERTSSWNKVNKVELPKATTILELTEFYQNLSEVDKQNWESKYADRMSEAFDVIGSCNSNSECKEKLTEAGYGDVLLPEWATINLYTTGDSSAYAYWTSTPLAYPNVFSSPPGLVWNVFHFGHLFYDFFNNSDNVGGRPVIHISQSNILSKLEAPEYVNPDDVGSVS